MGMLTFTDPDRVAHSPSIDRRDFLRSFSALLAPSVISGALSSPLIAAEHPQCSKAARVCQRGIELAAAGFNYVVDNMDPATGLLTDCAPAYAHDARRGDIQQILSGDRCSIATTGFGLAALPAAVEQGQIDIADAVSRVKLTISTLQRVQAELYQHTRGWLPHFLVAGSAASWPGTEISSLDSAICINGLLIVAEYLAHRGQEWILKDAMGVFNSIDFPFMLTNGGTEPEKLAFSHGLILRKGEYEFIRCDYSKYSEGALIPFLALAAQGAHEVSDAVWTKGWERKQEWFGDVEPADERGCLFEYFYLPLLAKFDGRKDVTGFSPEAVARGAIATQLRECPVLGFPEKIFGVSACRAPALDPQARRYWPFKLDSLPDMVVAPPSTQLAMPWAPAAVAECISILERFGVQPNRYGLPCAVEFRDGVVAWTAPDVIGIDVVAPVLAADAVTSQVVHSLSLRSEALQRSLRRAGFLKG